VLSESELVQLAADNATMGRAQQLLQEEKDEVKHMNRIMRYAKCAAMREQQIQVGVGMGILTAAALGVWLLYVAAFTSGVQLSSTQAAGLH
jgi:hypothetical protein